MPNISEPEKEVTANAPRTYEEQAHKPIWEIIDEIISEVPEDILNSLPADGAERHDDYLRSLREHEQ
jgi:hypothetical protein